MSFFGLFKLDENVTLSIGYYRFIQNPYKRNNSDIKIYPILQ